MTTIRSTLYALGAILLAALWVTQCHDPSVRAEAAKIAADAKADSVRADHDRWKAAFLREDSARGDSLAKLARDVTSAHIQIRRLKSHVISRDSVTIIGTNSVFYRQLALRDSTIERQDLVIDYQDKVLALYRGQIAARDTLIGLREADIRSLVVSRDTWRKVAERRWFCVGGVGGTLGISGNAALGAGFTCGYRLNG